MIWKFDAETGWAPTPAPWGQHADAVSDYLGDHDYRLLDNYGNDEGRVVAIWRSEQEYVVELNDESDRILTVGLPSLLALLREAAPLIDISHKEHMRMTVEKAFQAWHGHHTYTPCDKCDPDEMAREKERAVKRAKALATL